MMGPQYHCQPPEAAFAPIWGRQKPWPSRSWLSMSYTRLSKCPPLQSWLPEPQRVQAVSEWPEQSGWEQQHPDPPDFLLLPPFDGGQDCGLSGHTAWGPEQVLCCLLKKKASDSTLEVESSKQRLLIWVTLTFAKLFIPHQMGIRVQQKHPVKQRFVNDCNINNLQSLLWCNMRWAGAKNLFSFWLSENGLLTTTMSQPCQVTRFHGKPQWRFYGAPSILESRFQAADVPTNLWATVITLQVFKNQSDH